MITNDLPEVNESLKSQERALTILSFVETLEALTNNYAAFVNTLPPEHKAEAKTYLSTLSTLCASLNDEGLDLTEQVKSAETLVGKFPSKIKRLGIASDIVSAVLDKGMTYEQVADRFGIQAETIKRFFKIYKQAAPTTKARMMKNNVYDIEYNMQNLHGMLLRQLARFESDGEVSARFISEYRQLLSMAEKQLKEWSSQKKIDQLGIVIQEVMLKYCLPEARQQVLKEFQTLGIKGLAASVDQPKPILQA